MYCDSCRQKIKGNAIVIDDCAYHEGCVPEELKNRDEIVKELLAEIPTDCGNSLSADGYMEDMAGDVTDYWWIIITDDHSNNRPIEYDKFETKEEVYTFIKECIGQDKEVKCILYDGKSVKFEIDLKLEIEGPEDDEVEEPADPNEVEHPEVPLPPTPPRDYDI